MKHYFVLKVDSVLKAFDICDTQNSLFFKTRNLNVELHPEDHILLYIKEPIDEVRYLFAVQSVEEDGYRLKKILENGKGVSYNQIPDISAKLSDSSIDIFDIDESTFLHIIGMLYENPFLTTENEQPDKVRFHTDISLTDSKILKYLTALRTKPFMLLAGISGTGKSRIVRKLAQATVTEKLQNYQGNDFSKDRWKLHAPANFQLIQVKPNWHNSMDVVGYLTNIPETKYVFTPFINFIAKAWLHPDVPFFLCLDEMNIAPVEEYFAEFLSAIESRSFENGKYLTDPIIKPFDEFEKCVGDKMLATLYGEKDTNITKEIKDHFRNRGLTLPKNLIVIGTVNMDETTFSFSRKVLDRAMSIEMNEVDYESFLMANTDEDLQILMEAFDKGKFKREDGTTVSLNELLVNRHVEAKEVTKELSSDARFVIDYLETINCLLDGTPFKLGYRAANEALIYVRSCQEFGIDDTDTALDDFTLMKILSRIEGDESKLKITDSTADRKKLRRCGIFADNATQYGELTLLTALREIIKNKLGEFTEDTNADQSEDADDGNSVDSNEEQRKSIQKIDQMISQLARDHFVSYWN